MTRVRLFIVLVLLTALGSMAQLASASTTSDEQQRAVNDVNAYRQAVGMPPVSLRSSLNTASSKHSLYMYEADDFGHYEAHSSNPYYVAYSPTDRASKFGYTNQFVNEDILWTSSGSKGTPLLADTATQWWMGAIYHRFAIISPNTKHIGFGTHYAPNKNFAVMDFGGDYGDTGPIVRWPMPNQSGVPGSVSNELPNPLVPCYGNNAPSKFGYPISISWFHGAVKYTSISLKNPRTGWQPQGCRLSPQNDQFHKYSTSLSFVPKYGLRYSTKYTVSFKGVYASDGDLSHGKWFSYSWSFTTQP